LQTIASHEIDTVLTFDRGGVSGHANHTSLYNAMVFLSLENRLPRGKEVL
jgi:LmbE family N-acetylglucosaminyl deacetylase